VFVMLNRTDGLWDGLRDEARIEAEIGRQVDSVAATLGVEPAAVFPVSAQKGLVARIQGDEALLARSRVPQLERALAEGLLPAKQEIVREDILAESAEARASPPPRAACSRRAWPACANSSRNLPTCAARTRASSNT